MKIQGYSSGCMPIHVGRKKIEINLQINDYLDEICKFDCYSK